MEVIFVMDYQVIASQLLDLQLVMRPEPASRLLYTLENGTFLALQYLSERKNDVHPKELSRKMSVSTARIAALLNHMERDGLIIRNPDPTDSRQVTICLTELGEQLIKSKKAEMVSLIARALEELGQEDAEIYFHITKRLLQSFLKLAEQNNKKALPDGVGKAGAVFKKGESAL